MLHEHAPVETWERHPGASLKPLRRYRRRQPEKTVLYSLVRSWLEPFLAAARDRRSSGRGLPAYVESDLRAYLECGILANGFARIRCPDCGFERLVAFSCKARSCPSCNARRMEDAADHLANDVFPAVPVRQWVLSFPRQLRFQAARDPRVASHLLDLFTRALFAWQRRSARRLGVNAPRTAGVTAIQRFGGAINLNVHFHTLVPDGVFDLSGDGPARFVQLPPPNDEGVSRVLTAVIRRSSGSSAHATATPVPTRTPSPPSKPGRSIGEFAFPTPSSTRAGQPTSGCGSTRTTAWGWSGSAGTQSGPRSPSTG